MTFESAIPPTQDYGFGSDHETLDRSKLKIYVPSESVDDYKNAEGWSFYADLIFANTSDVNVTASPSEPPEKSINKKGDLDGNDNIDVTDLTMVSLYLIGDQEFTDEQKKAADVTGDGNTDLADLARLRQFLSKKIDKLDAE